MIKVKDIRTFLIDSLHVKFSKNEIRGFHRLITEHFCAYSPAQVLMHAEELLDEPIIKVIKDCVKQIQSGKPIQYILGYTWFYGNIFQVNPSVLIPRPETEELVDWILKEQKDVKTILDIGTGSGSIAISLALHSSAQVSAIDLSIEALLIAKSNAFDLDAEIDFIHMDLFDKSQTNRLNSYDLIVSNPPYVFESDKSMMEDHVLNHEPHEALFVPDDNALKYYESIANLALIKLNSGGFLYIEIHELKGNEIVDMLGLKGFHDISLKKDFQGKNRMVKAICKL